MKISLTDDATTKLRTLLAAEGEDAVLRIRETKVGSACKSRLVLMLSIDEREDGDLEGEAESMPFVINEDLADQYGQSFSICLCENGLPTVTAQN